MKIIEELDDVEVLAEDEGYPHKMPRMCRFDQSILCKIEAWYGADPTPNTCICCSLHKIARAVELLRVK